MDFIKHWSNRMPIVQAGRDLIGPVFDMVARPAGELAIIHSIQSAAFVKRYIHPDLDRSALNETELSFDSHESILDYYGVSIDVGYDYFCGGLQDNKIEGEEIPQRAIDVKEIIFFVNKVKARLSLLGRNKPVQVIDFGAGFGAQAYKSQVIASDTVKTWTVVDLPFVVSSAKLIQERAIQLMEKNKVGFNYLKSVEKINFASSIDEISIDEDAEQIIIINGVWMHLADPEDVLTRLLLKIKPSALMIGNNFEMGPNVLKVAQSYSRSPLVVSGTSGSMDHKFAIDAPGVIPQVAYNISTKLRHVPVSSFISQRDRVNFKLYQVVGRNEWFIDSELNRCFHFMYV